MKRRQIEIKKKNKRAVSSMVGYVLLITFGIILSVIAYNYLKTYVPKDIVDCPDATSIFIKEYNCNASLGQLNVTLKNNGKFNYAGFYIHAAKYKNQSIATINLVHNFTNSSSTEMRPHANTYILFSAGNQNKMKPGTEDEAWFNISTTYEIIEVTPIRFEKDGNTVRFASCGNSKIKEEIIC